MGALTILPSSCSWLEPPAAPPEVTVPFLGKLTQVRKSLYQLPDGSEIWLRFLNSLNLAMAPARQFIELLELMGLYKDCMTAIPEAILSLNPDPVYTCLKKLVRKIATLLSFFPPMSYVRLIVDCLKVAVQLLDEMVLMLSWLDQQLTSWNALIANANALGDTTLLEIAGCQAAEFGVVAINANDVMRVVSPLIRMLLEPIVSYIPSEPLKQAVVKLTDLESQLASLDATIRAAAERPAQELIEPMLEALTQLVDALVLLQTILVDVYNVVCYFLGLEPLAHRSRPLTENF